MAIRPLKGRPGIFVSTTTGKKFKIVEWREDDKYDTIELQSGTTDTANGDTHNFFRDLSNKEDIDTNLSTARRIEAGEEMIIDRIGLYIALCSGNGLCLPADVKKVAADLSAARALLSRRADLDPQRLGCLALDPGATPAATWAERAGDVCLVRRPVLLEFF